LSIKIGGPDCAESYEGKAMGTGLGLYISKLLVEKFGGQIGVKSEKDKGKFVLV